MLPPGDATPLVYADDLSAPVLAPDDRHHLARVLRVRDGDAITVSDGAGRWRPCRFGPEVEPDGGIVHVAAPAPGLSVAFAAVKGDPPAIATLRLDRESGRLTEVGRREVDDDKSSPDSESRST